MQVRVSSRERVEAAIGFQVPDRLPFNFWMDRRRMAELEEKYGPEFRVTRYDADVIECYFCFPAFPSGEYVVRDGTGWLARELFEDWRALRDVPMPDPHEPRLYERLDSYLREFGDRAVIVNSPNVLTIAEMMRRQENLYVDMLTQPDDVRTAFERFSDVMAAVAEHVCRRDITALYVQDDVAYNNGLLISPDLAEEFVYPNWKKVIDVAHGHGKPVFFHTDGKCDAIWDLLAERLGVRMLNPLQPDLQDLGEFKRRFHGRMGVYGGIATDRFHTMTPEEIREHVVDLHRKTGADGGLIASTHDIDYSVTEAQLEAYADAAKGCVG